MNGGEVNTIKGTVSTGVEEVPRTANPDEKRDALRWEATDWGAAEQFINKAQTRIAKAQAANRNRGTAREQKAAKPGERPTDARLLEA